MVNALTSSGYISNYSLYQKPKNKSTSIEPTYRPFTYNGTTVTSAFLYDYGRDMKVTHMPLEIRDVPIHKDDDYASKKNQGPIEQEEYSVNGSGEILMTFHNYFNTILPIDIGGGIGFFFYPGAEDARRNYTNDVGTPNRGVGAALTFCSLNKMGLFESYYFPDIVPRVHLEIPVLFEGNILDFWGFSAGADISYSRLVAVNGWDRFNSLEKKDDKTLAHLYPVNIYGRIYLGAVIAGGVRLNDLYSLTDLGKKAGIEMKDKTWFFSIGFCVPNE